MQLTDYTIHGQGDNKIIHLETPELIVLEWFLNENVRKPSNAEIVLNEYYELRDNWDNLDSYVETNFSGFWDEENLFLTGNTGVWFSFYDYINFEVDVNVDTRYIYISDAFREEVPKSGLPLDEFIDILEQWKEL